MVRRARSQVREDGDKLTKGRGGVLGPQCVCCFHQGQNCLGPVDGVLRPYGPGCYHGFLKSCIFKGESELQAEDR